jgi:hypothetical protein
MDGCQTDPKGAAGAVTCRFRPKDAGAGERVTPIRRSYEFRPRGPQVAAPKALEQIRQLAFYSQFCHISVTLSTSSHTPKKLLKRAPAFKIELVFALRARYKKRVH